MPSTLATAVHRTALSAYRVLPAPLRRAVVRRLTPRYSIGTVVALRRGGLVLMLRQRHHDGWTLPGGLLARGETPSDAAARELAEELALTVVLPRRPTLTHVDPWARHVDVLYVVDLEHAEPVVTVDGLEVLEARWRRPEDPHLNEATATLLALLDDRDHSDHGDHREDREDREDG